MHPKTLRVRASGTALVQDYDALERPTPVTRFIGRKYAEKPEAPGEFGFVPSGDEEVPYRPEYLKALLDGDLDPADEATAAICGKTLSPNGDE